MAKLRDIMATDVLSAAASSPVFEVAHAMLERRVGSAVVLEGPWLCGIFTERDVLRAAASGADLTTSPIGEWMAKDPVSGTPDTESEEAADIMLANGFRHLPVLENERLVGIVSLRDILGSRIRRLAR